MSHFNHLLRENIRNITPYSSARDEFQGEASIYLDANENPFDNNYNRYPDPYQTKLKKAIVGIKDVSYSHIFLGNGSDEIIDLFIRAFCEPYRESIVALNPSYGMYAVAAELNAVSLRKYLLNADFSLDVDGLISFLLPTDKLLFLCSPNNPTGNTIPRSQIIKLLDSFEGIVIVDAAYADFMDDESYFPLMATYPKLVIMQTLSKAWASAGLRIGMAFMHSELVAILNSIKPPYNLSSIAQDHALQLLSKPDMVKDQIVVIKKERKRLTTELLKLKSVIKVYPSQANFVLIEVEDADRIYTKLMEEGIIVRNRSKQALCSNCLRITIGTPQENTRLLEKLAKL